MRAAIKELPHTLVLHLKRFEWDFETETRFKKKDRFAFPLELDMYRYTLEGLAEAEAARDPSVRFGTLPTPVPSTIIPLLLTSSRQFDKPVVMYSGGTALAK